jgi:hypothetical protein
LADWGAIQHETSAVRKQKDVPITFKLGLVEAQISTDVNWLTGTLFSTRLALFESKTIPPLRSGLA